MTREQLVKIRFKAYSQVNFINPRNKKVIECYLIAINFDNELLSLEPFDRELYMDDPFIAHCSNCSFPKEIKLEEINNQK